MNGNNFNSEQIAGQKVEHKKFGTGIVKALKDGRVNAILIVGHSDTEKVYHQHHIPCKIETTLYARRERYGSGDVTLLTNPGSICLR